MTLSCILVDDNLEFLESAKAIFAGTAIDVVGIAQVGVEAGRLARELEPDVALVDVNLGGESGVHVAAMLAALDKPPRIILISTLAEDDLAALAKSSAAEGFLAKAKLSADAVLALVR